MDPKEFATMFPAQLKAGVMVDLAGDRFADPKGYDPEFECEFATVECIDIETPDCVCVYFESGRAFGFPADHALRCPAFQFPDE